MSKKMLSIAAMIGQNEAKKSPLDARYCALIFDRNKLVSKAYNTYKGSYYGNKQQYILCS